MVRPIYDWAVNKFEMYFIMPQASRPAPAPTVESSPYWEAAKRGVLELQQCEECGHVSFPPRSRCSACLSQSLRWTEMSGRAKLRGWCEIHISALPGHEPPITVVEVTLEEDPTAVLVALDESSAVKSLAPDSAVQIRMNADENGWSYPEIHPRPQSEPDA